MSGESEVFDSDEDTKYGPSDKDDNVYKMSRMFKLRYQRQLEPDQTAGTPRSMDYVSDEIHNLLPLKMYVRKKTDANVKWKRDNTKNIPASKRKKKESTKKKTKKRDEVAEKEKGNVNIEDERQNIE